jgi:hypothetical protein
MKHLKQTLVLMLLSSFICACTFAQDLVVNSTSQDADQQRSDTNTSPSMTAPKVPIFDPRLKAQRAEEDKLRLERAKEVRQDNEYTVTGNERGSFFDNPLMINGTPLDYGEFTLESAGELTVIKKAPITGATIEVPFYIYLRRDGIKVSLPQGGRHDSKQTKINLSEILDHAKAGDHLIIEAVNKEDGAIKRILKLLNNGC